MGVVVALVAVLMATVTMVAATVLGMLRGGMASTPSCTPGIDRFTHRFE